jgi:acetyl esterase/lipase
VPEARPELEEVFAHLGRPAVELPDPILAMRAMVNDYGMGCTGAGLAQCRVEPLSHARIAGEWLIPEGHVQDRRIVYLHGGGWAAGSLASHRAMAAELAARSGRALLLVDYRLAPEHPFPAGLEDCVAALALAQERGPGKEGRASVTLMGDSAGANLAAAATLACIADGLPLPERLVLFSPFLAPEIAPRSSFLNPVRDPVVTAAAAAGTGQLYTTADLWTAPLVAPLHAADADLGSFPHTLVQASASEALRDQAFLFCQRLWANGVTAKLSLWGAMPHAWQCFTGKLAEADEALDEATRFAVAA